MTTNELIQWAHKAKQERAESWDDGGAVHGPGFTLSIFEAVEFTKPAEATSWEVEIVEALLNVAWEECQDWYKEAIKKA